VTAIQLPLIFGSGALSAYVVSLILRRWRTRWTALVVNAAMSFALGAFAAADPLYSSTTSKLGFAAFGTVVSLVFVADRPQVAPADLRSAIRLTVDVLRLLAMHAALCATFAMAGFLVADAAAILVYKIP
jgi:hypothetical protein